MKKLRFSIIEMFLEDVPRNEIIAPETPEIAAEQRRYQIIGYCVLIDHPTLGKILYDTGCAFDWKESWNDTMKSLYRFIFINNLEEKLKELGVTPSDIDILIMSHLHYDHAGNLRLFQGTKAGRQVIISAPEAAEAFVKVNLDDTGYSGAYWKPEFQNLPGLAYRTIDRDTKLADDIELFIQRGHTPGVIGLVLHTEKSGSFIFTSDAVYSAKNYGPPVVLPGFCVDPDAYKANIDNLRKMQKEYNATVVFSHDVEDVAKLKKSPHFYE